MSLKSLKLFVCLFIVTIVVAACSTDDKVVAVVNGEEITLKELNKRVSHIKKGFESQGVDFETEEGKQLEQEIVQKTLDDLIEEALVRQQAEKEGVLLSEEEIDKKIEEIKASFSNIEEYQRELQNMNITESDLRKIILNEFSRENLFQKITNNINAVEDDQVWEYYKQNPEQFIVPETLVVRHILFFCW
ncbi:SurA N-terminal domain-containing protein [Peptococcaceae bacterium]|nr:SurA N-terminal domain-containing protein [Peptococcaceae bacterium]